MDVVLRRTGEVLALAGLISCIYGTAEIGPLANNPAFIMFGMIGIGFGSFLAWINQ